MAKRDVQVGQIYQTVGRTYLGRSAALWVVREIHTGTDGLGYARLEHMVEPGMVKTIGIDALLDPRLFMLRPG
jgi:hypothetical protein